MNLHFRIFASSFVSLLSTFVASAQVNVTTWQVDLQHSGNNAAETALTPGAISSPGNFGMLFAQPMDGQSYGQPLIVSGLSIGGATHNVVFAATEHCSVYAFDADSASGLNSNPLWKVSLIPSGCIPVPQSVVGSSDIPVELGITTTPVIDVASSTIYIVSKVQRTSDSSYHQYLHALDLTTGANKSSSPVEINPTFPGSSNDSVNNVIPFSALHEHLRSAMALYKGVIYLAYASHSDTTPYHGEIIGYDASTLQLVKTFTTTPNGRNPEGGIWQSGASPAVDADGNMYVAVGNGLWDQNNPNYGTNWGESMLKLPTSGAFTVSYSNKLNWFTPNNYPTLNNYDLDLGSGGLTLLPDQAGPHTHIMVGGGKGGVLYVVDRDNLGGLNTPDQAIQEISEPDGNWIFTTPAYYNGYIYYSTAGGSLQQRAVGYNPADGTYIAPKPIVSDDPFNNKGSGCFISSNGSTNGIVWILTGYGFYAYDARNVSGKAIFGANATIPGNITCETTKFSLPMVANGKVYHTAYHKVNDTAYNGYLMVYGLLPTSAGTPGSPSDATAKGTSYKSISVNWVRNSNNESGFKIKRSSSGASGSFVVVGTAGAGVTTYSDSGLSPTTRYYYQVVATNANGDSNATNVATATTFPTYTENGLVAYWPLDERGGTTVNDVTANAHNGATNGEHDLAAAMIDFGVNLHGTGQAVSNIVVPNRGDLQFSANGSFTLSTWVYPSALRNSDETIIAKSRDQGNYYGIWINDANKWVFRGPAGEVVGSTAVGSAWTHVTAVQDGPANTRKIYINGMLAGSGAAQAADGAGELWMGQQKLTNGNGSPNYASFPGLIDEVRLYNRALGSGEITNLMGAPVLEAQSDQVQGNSGTFGVVIWPYTVKAIEPRKGATVGKYTLTLNFSAPVSGVSATLKTQSGASAVGSVGAVSYDSTRKVVTITLNGVGTAQSLILHLAGVMPGNGTADIPFNVLWGDVNADNIANFIDSRIVNETHIAIVDAARATYDLNGDGAIDSKDDTVAGAADGTSLGAQTDTNLAYYATSFESSDNGTLYTSARAFDYSQTTRWDSAHGVDPQYIYVNLGVVCNVHAVKLVWENSAGKDYTIDVSTTGTDDGSWTTIKTVQGNTLVGNSLPTYTGFNVPARYVRVRGTARTGPYGYSLFDFQVIGVLASNPSPSRAPTINSADAASVIVGAAFNYQITATNSPTSYGATGLPSTLSVNSTTGVISGTPSETGTINATIQATNAAGAASTALMIVVQTPLESWQTANFTKAELSNSSVSGLSACPAGDGIVNLIKYALNLNPKVNGSGGLPVISTTAVSNVRCATLTYMKVLAATDLTYTVEVSNDMKTWNSGQNYTTRVSTINSVDGKTQVVTSRDITGANRFIRLRISH